MKQELAGKINHLSKGRIDPQKGLEACGSPQIYLDVLKDFALAAEAKMEELSDYLKNGDIEGFVVKVHALKSTARFLGAEAFSEMAWDLEERGASLEAAELEELSGRLLEEYGFLANAVKDALPGDQAACHALISEQALQNALKAIRELAEKFDFDQIDYIMGRLGEYELPEGFSEDFHILKCHVTDVDRDGIIDCLSRLQRN